MGIEMVILHIVAALVVALAVWIVAHFFLHPPAPWTLHPNSLPWHRCITMTFDPEVMDPAFRRELALDWEWDFPPLWEDPEEKAWVEHELLLAIDDAWADYNSWAHWRAPFLGIQDGKVWVGVDLASPGFAVTVTEDGYEAEVIFPAAEFGDSILP